MKFLLSFCLLSLGLGACIHKESLSVDIEQRHINCEAFENFTVPVREGYTTYVTYQGDTLAVASEAITIRVPKGSSNSLVKSTSSPLKIDYGVLKEGTTYSQQWQAVMFEDTRTGDYDYNDLVLHVNNRFQRQNKDNILTIKIQPIALGSTKTISLGCIICDDRSEHILSEDVRKDLFQDQTGFINTVSSETPVRYPLEPLITDYRIAYESVNSSTIAWFIEVEGKRYYAVSGELDYKDYDMFNQDAMPYGLVMHSTFAYAEEKQSIYEAYPNFLKWLNGNSQTIGSGTKSLLYKYVVRPCSPYLWDYNDF